MKIKIRSTGGYKGLENHTIPFEIENEFIQLEDELLYIPYDVMQNLGVTHYEEDTFEGDDYSFFDNEFEIL